MSYPDVGALCFGFVVGWICYRTLRRKEGAAALSDIATVLGAIGGATVTGLFKDEHLFASYCIGVAIGFFAYLAIGTALFGKEDARRWMGE